MIISDLHIHSRFSRACSKSLNIANLEKWAKVKGIGLLGTGDFSHPEWNPELKRDLTEDGSGILKTKTGFPFMLTNEISLMYTQDGKGRRVHIVLFAPNFEVVDQITNYLKSKGRIDYDGRPIFKIPCYEFAENLMSISKDIEIIPAHCLLPGSYIHSNLKLKKIDKIKKHEKVLTHTGEFKKIQKIYKRSYNGKVYKVIPWYFREGLTTTPEHQFYAIKSFKNCSWTKGTCKPLCSQKSCKKKYYDKYSPEWVQAKDLEKSDFLVYPRITKLKDITTINLFDYIGEIRKYSRTKQIKENIIIDKDFCRLAGYYLAEGYTIRDEGLAFSFNKNEKEYIKEVIDLMSKIFGINYTKIDDRKGVDIIFYSHILNKLFKKLFYSGKEKRAWTKSVPEDLLFLSKGKQTELLRGWWRGDAGYTVSHDLASQMKLICIRLGIIPSIAKDSAESFNSRGNHFHKNRKISTNKDTFIFSNLSFFEKSDLIKDKSFSKFINKINRKHGWIDKDYIYLPIRNIEISKYSGPVYNLEVEEDNSYTAEFATVHNCWTPWFGILGSKSGFDTIEQAFKDKTKYIHALETGMSSDPAMNWRYSKLDKFQMVSFSDSHSFWPWRIGREATIFDTKMNYKEIINAIRTGEGLKSTVEVDPGYGKYHWDGHRNCGISFSPKETKENKGICPVCKRSLTVGVEYRVEELADRPEGFIPEGKPEFKTLIPLSELIAAVNGTKQLNGMKIMAEYNKLIAEFGSEYNILLNAPKEQLVKHGEKLAEVILKNRVGQIKVKPGFDGVYGVAIVTGDEKQDFGKIEPPKKDIQKPIKQQTDLSNFSS